MSDLLWQVNPDLSFSDCKGPVPSGFQPRPSFTRRYPACMMVESQNISDRKEVENNEGPGNGLRLCRYYTTIYSANNFTSWQPVIIQNKSKLANGFKLLPHLQCLFVFAQLLIVKAYISIYLFCHFLWYVCNLVCGFVWSRKTNLPQRKCSLSNSVLACLIGYSFSNI